MLPRQTKESWAKPSLKTDQIDVPELGVSVRIRELPGTFTEDAQELLEIANPGGRNQSTSLNAGRVDQLSFAYGVIDDEGEPIYNAEEAKEIASKHGSAFRRVTNAINELSDFSAEAIEAAEGRFLGSGGGAARDNGTADPAGDGGPDVPLRVGAGDGEVAEGAD